MSAQQSKLEKIDQLRAALADYVRGENSGHFFDAAEEEAKAQVRKRALRLLDERGRSRKELRDRLIAAEFPPAVVDAVLDDLAAVKLIDDAIFAQEWVRQRHFRRGKTTRVLDRELREKGINARERDVALAQVTPCMEEEKARDLAAKKARSVSEVPQGYVERQKVLRRIVGVLARRGFSQGLSLRVATAALDNRCAELRQS